MRRILGVPIHGSGSFARAVYCVTHHSDTPSQALIDSRVSSGSSSPTGPFGRSAIGSAVLNCSSESRSAGKPVGRSPEADSRVPAARPCVSRLPPSAAASFVPRLTCVPCPRRRPGALSRRLAPAPSQSSRHRGPRSARTALPRPGERGPGALCGSESGPRTSTRLRGAGALSRHEGGSARDRSQLFPFQASASPLCFPVATPQPPSACVLHQIWCWRAGARDGPVERCGSTGTAAMHRAAEPPPIGAPLPAGMAWRPRSNRHRPRCSRRPQSRTIPCKGRATGAAKHLLD